MIEACRLMAKYNARMNKQLYEAAAQLGHEAIIEDRGAFFRSVLGTLNHILVGDILWLKRLAKHPLTFRSLTVMNDQPQPSSLDQMLYEDFPALKIHREAMDKIIVTFADELTQRHINSSFSYTNSRGDAMTKNTGFIIQHLFNHQTHHRGQVTTLLAQSGMDVGVTDLLMDIPDA